MTDQQSLLEQRMSLLSGKRVNELWVYYFGINNFKFIYFKEKFINYVLPTFSNSKTNYYSYYTKDKDSYS